MSGQTPDQAPDQTLGQIPDQTSGHTPDTTPDPAPVADLDNAPDGTALFAADAGNLPEDTGEGGVVTTARDGGTGWQLAVLNNRPRVIWQRTWHAADDRWRGWKRFEDSRNANRAAAAAVASAIAASERGMTALVDGRITAEAAARSAAIASAIAAAIDEFRDGLPAELPAPGLDRDAVTGLIDARVEAELEDERTARNDAIAAAASSLAAGRQALIDAGITSAITTERVAADQRTDGKLALVTTRIDGLADDLTAESAARAAAITAAGGAMEARVTAERGARTAALATRQRAVAAEITEAKQEAASNLQTAILAERGARDQAITAARSEVTRDAAAHVTGLLRGLEGRVTRTIDAGIAAAGFPRGTRMLFRQSAAPAGWTKDGTIHDKALRVVSGSVGSGGSKGFLSVFGRNSSARLSSSVRGGIHGHRLTEAQMPSHAHFVANDDYYAGDGNPHERILGQLRARHLIRQRHRSSQEEYNLYGSERTPHIGLTSAAGGNQPHSHGHEISVSTAFASGALDLAYVDVIVAAKD